MATEYEAAVDLLIIGSGPTGVSALRSYRDRGGSGRALMISDDPDLAYERPPLSKDYLRGTTGEDDIRLLEPGELDKLSAETSTSPVVALDPGRHLVRDLAGSSWSYRWCVLATGSQPQLLPVPGGDDPRILRLRTLEDARSLRAAATSGARTAAVIGSGFIGCEAAASLARLGLNVTLISDETAPQQRRLGAAAAGRIAGWLREDRVQLITDATITRLDVGSDAVTIALENGPSVQADIVLTAVGARPRSDLAAAAGLAMKEGRILTDARMRTVLDGVLAAGDVAMAFNAAAGRPLAVEHWGEALRMGEIAGATAAGAEDEWQNAPGFWSQVGDHQLKYAAWGDGFEQAQLREHAGGAFTIWYTDRTGATVGVLTHERDDDYEQGTELVETAAKPPL